MAEAGLFRHSTDRATFNAGDVIFQAGEPADVMYVVQAGQVDIVAKGEVINTLGEGEFFGEMALIDHSPRSASAVAQTACTITRVDETSFVFSLQNNPYFALQLLRTLADRIRRRTAV